MKKFLLVCLVLLTFLMSKAQPSITLSPVSQTICAGSSASIGVTATGGTPPYTYLWSNSATSSSISVSPTTTTVYGVQVCGGGCINGTVIVVVAPTPTIYAIAIPTVICAGNTVTLTAFGANTYTWQPGNIIGASPVVTPSFNTIYSVSGTSSLGCVGISASTSLIYVNPIPTLTILANPSNTVCLGSSVILNASGAVTYTWSNLSNGNLTVITPTSSGSYSVSGTDGFFCTGSSSINVYVNPLPTLSITANPTNAVCIGNSATLTASGALTYTWSNSIFTASSVVAPSISTNYTVIGAGPGGCIGSATMAVLANPLPTVTINTSNTLVCMGSSATLTASGANTYSWNTGSVNAVLNLTPTATANYSVIGTSLNGCTTTAVQSVSVNPLTNLIGSVTSTAGTVTGSVILYKKTNLSGPWDSITTVNITSSAYAFNGIPSATYAVLAVPTQTDLVETYGTSSVSWQGANLLSHSCISNTTENINVLSLLNIGTGPGSMSGNVSGGIGYGNKGMPASPGNPLRGITVKAFKNPGGNVIGRTITNNNGDYLFANIPTSGTGESYFILVDIPGVDTNGTYHKIILAGSETYSNLNFEVDSVKINPMNLTVGLTEWMNEKDNLIIYPNPNNGNFIVSGRKELALELFNTLGQKVKSITLSNENNYQNTISSLPIGVYFIKWMDNLQAYTFKILVAN